MKLSKADEIAVNVNSGYQANVALRREPDVDRRRRTTTRRSPCTSAFGKKHATATTNDLSDDVAQARRRASRSAGEALARRSGSDAARSGRRRTCRSNGYFDATANLSPADRARAALTALEPARKAGDLQAAGFIVVDAGADRARQQQGPVRVPPLDERELHAHRAHRPTAPARDGRAPSDHDWTQHRLREASARARSRRRGCRANPVAIEPGRYTVILEPQAVGDLVQLIGGSRSSARSADEGRSAFAKPGGGNKIGEKIVDERVTIFSDPLDPQLLAQPFDGEGLPLGATGVDRERRAEEALLLALLGAEAGEAADAAAPASLKHDRAAPTTLDDMIASTQRGMLVTRFWYLRPVDPRTILYTGLTRDGTFLIENGKITKAVRTSASTSRRCSC